MLKRVIAFLILASLALWSAGCTDNSGQADGQGVDIAKITLPLWGPFAMVAHYGFGAFDNPQREIPATAEKTTATAERTRAAADKGDAEAQLELGYMYASGQGVPRDDAEAVKWYQKSANQGFGPAQIALAFMYRDARGVAQDNVQADMWFTVAASEESTTVNKFTPDVAMFREIRTQNAIKYRNDIEQRMTPEQIAEARKRAGEWKPI
jgi:Sel1 repeat